MAVWQGGQLELELAGTARREQASSHWKRAKEGFFGIAHSPAAEVKHTKLRPDPRQPITVEIL